MPWASQEVRDQIGRGSFEKKLNKLADDGWELVGVSTNSVGSLFFIGTQAAAILRREKVSDPED